MKPGAMPSEHKRKTLADVRTFAKYHLRRRVHDHPAPETELGIVDLGFDLDQFVAQLRSLGEPWQVDTLEELDYRGRTHPMLRVASPAAAAATCRTLLVLGGVHGNEHAGILAIPEILARHVETAVRLVVVAPVNPVGAAALSRYNADGFDINRDFVRFETREAQAVRRVVEEERPDFVISLHEGPQDAAFMFVNRHIDAALAAHLTQALADGGTKLAERDYFGRTLDPPGVAPMTSMAWWIQVLWAATLKMKSTDMWCDDLGIPEITLESSWRLADRAARIRPHVDLVAAVAAKLGSGDRGHQHAAGSLE